MSETVIVVVRDDLGSPVEGVQVHLYDEDNEYRLANTGTDPSGVATFSSVAEGYAYLRFYADHLDGTISSPHRIKVVEPPPNNRFEATCILRQQGINTGPNTCRIEGRLYPPREGARSLHVSYREDPIRVDGLGAVGGQKVVTSDRDGFFSFEEVRGSLLSLVVPGFEDEPILVAIPDTSRCSLRDLLFPLPKVLDIGPNLSLSEGGSGAMGDTTLAFSSGAVLSEETAPDDLVSSYVRYTSSNEGVATVSANSDGMPIVKAVAPGSSTISAELAEDGFPSVPSATLRVSDATVTVS